ncbi:MAG: endonuclease, partial [Bacteroidetes bacterium]|nr:endonuclease [Bacteroidota bacterium]
AMFYQMVCYNGQSGTWGFDYLLTEANLQDQALLKQWALQDPPDKFERTKNEYIFALQQNRNPFIDHPEWIDCINFDSLVKTNLCGAVGLPHNEALEIGLKLYPNPANNVLNIEIQSDFNTAAQLEVYDYMGRMLDSQVIDINMGYNIVTKQVSYLQNGNYLLKISNNGKWTYQKFVIVN